MKKLLLFFAAILAAGSMWANTYTHTFSTTEKTFTADGSQTISGVAWTLATTWVGTDKDYNKDSSQGLKIGSNSKQIQTMTLSTAGISGTINSVYIETNARSGAVVQMAVTVGGTSYTGASSFTGTGVYDTRAQLTYTGSSTGGIVINWDETNANSSKKGGFYVTKINVNYTPEGGSTATTYTITIDSNIANGQVTASNTSAEEGTNITLTATPANGYAFDAWDVKDANNNTITVTNNKFDMPASNVTVSASFNYVQSETKTCALVVLYEGMYYAAGTNLNNSKLPRIAVKVVDGVVYVASDSIKKSISWDIASSASGVTISPVGESTYLKGTSSSAGLSLETTACYWTKSTEEGNESYWIQKNNANYRTVTYQAGTTTAFKAYTTSNIGTSGYATTPAYSMPIEVDASMAYPLTVTEAGWASLCLPFDASIPANVDVFYANNVTNSTITLKPITEVIPAGTGVLVRATQGSYTFEASSNSRSAVENKLSGVVVATSFKGCDNYVMASVVNNLPVFKLYANADGDDSNIVLGANKAYLPASARPAAETEESAPERIGCIIEDITAVDNVEAGVVVKFVENGQLFIKKNGVIYNAMGQIVK